MAFSLLSSVVQSFDPTRTWDKKLGFRTCLPVLVPHSTQCDTCLGTSKSLPTRVLLGALQASGKDLVLLLPVDTLICS